ncbi:DUF2470 domain-containing protein [Geminocystis sp. NIES-3709]|uniref:DUF2470 domain-containing protein n=1 Tax=Geminocystis sp. NIES-3709 TaxID=1617448 RepID=UPI0005FC6CEF|nr:DUF2470 domain-containing protein [Geminocystis sp. NIES-3709]BAQ66269.1 hypothetical protein GM3709_3034 [Geminocystis sp. NIES-3709]
MTEIITQAISDRICKHMNDDHQDAVKLYAQYYGKIDTLETAKMLSIDPQGMYLIIDNHEENPLRIEFDHTLTDAKDAHTTLVEMMKQAK